MKVFQIILGLIQSMLSKIFPFFTYKGVINTQISIYNRLRKRAPEMSENELLNHLIMLRAKARPGVASKEEEYAHYLPLIENPDKTLQDVIWAIIDYEYIESRREYLYNRLLGMGLSPIELLSEINAFDLRVRKEIEESIEKRLKG